MPSLFWHTFAYIFYLFLTHQVKVQVNMKYIIISSYYKHKFALLNIYASFTSIKEKKNQAKLRYYSIHCGVLHELSAAERTHIKNIRFEGWKKSIPPMQGIVPTKRVRKNCDFFILQTMDLQVFCWFNNSVYNSL